MTLNEKRTLDNGYYLFRFENITTRDVVSKIFAFSEDLSDYPTRFNRFNVNTSTLFSGADSGLWRYTVYEQDSALNTDPDGLTEVERGLLELLPQTEFTFTEYSGTTSYKQYGG